MAWKLAEGLVDEMVAFATSDFGAILDDIDTNINDGIILEDPVIIEITEKRLESIEKFPIMIIIVEDTTIPQWTNVEAWGVHRLVIGMVVGDENPSDLRRRLYRYGRAIFELMGDAHGDAAVTFEIGVGETRIDFSPLFAASESRYVGDVTVAIPVVLKETQ